MFNHQFSLLVMPLDKCNSTCLKSLVLEHLGQVLTNEIFGSIKDITTLCISLMNSFIVNQKNKGKIQPTQISPLQRKILLPIVKLIGIQPTCTISLQTLFLFSLLSQTTSFTFDEENCHMFCHTAYLSYYLKILLSNK